MKIRNLICLIIIIIVGLFASWIWRGAVQCHQEDYNTNALNAPYKVIFDDMGTNIRISVDKSISEDLLRLTLIKAANDHQHDRARDYLMFSYLWIEAYLEEDGKRSAIPAGRLRRYVPPINPDVISEVISCGEKQDKVIIFLRESRDLLNLPKEQ